MAILDLFRANWKHSNPNKRIEAIKNLTNQNLLADIAKNDKDYSVRQVAYRMLGKEKSQEALADIVKNDEDEKLRKKAVKKLTSRSLLADIAANDKDYSIRQVAYRILGQEKSQEALVDVVKNDKDENIKNEAFQELTYQNLLADIEVDDRNCLDEIIDRIKKCDEEGIEPYLKKLSQEYGITNNLILTAIKAFGYQIDYNVRVGRDSFRDEPSMESSDEAIDELCKTECTFSNLILYQIAGKKNVTVSLAGCLHSYEYTFNFSYQRQKSRIELIKRLVGLGNLMEFYK